MVATIANFLAPRYGQKGCKMLGKCTKTTQINRNRSIWLRLGPYLCRMVPTGSGKPLGYLPAPKTIKKNIKNTDFLVWGPRGPRSPMGPLLALSGCGQYI